MSRLIATRVSDDQYSKIMGKCSGLGCSVYDYLKMLVQSDIADSEKANEAKEKKQTEYRKQNEDFERLVQTIRSISNGKESSPIRE